MRIWAIACAVIVLLLLVPLGIEYRLAHPTVPTGIQRAECLTPPPEGETDNDRFIRQGGRFIRYPNAQWTDSGYNARDIAHGRDLNRYERLVLRDPEPHHFWEMKANPFLAQARSFLWSNWQSRKPAYLVLTMSGIDATTTWHLFVESDDSGRWRVFRRLLSRGRLVDLPTSYAVEWVIPTGWNKPGTPIPAGQAPDPTIDELEFRDVCGETIESF